MELNEILGVSAVPAIAIICYLVSEVIKLMRIETRWIPAACGISGAILGIIAWLLMPEFPAVDILTAMAIGIVSGFSATGIHQLFKQLSK